MAKKPPATLRAIDLVDARGAADIVGCTRSRISQYAQGGRLKTYVFIEGDLVEAEGEERQGRTMMFDRYEVGRLPHYKEGRPRKSNIPTS